MKRPGVNLSELSDDVRGKVAEKLGYKNRRRTFTKEQVRSRALDVLAEISDLTQDQRRQVLAHAVKVNAI